MPKISFSASTAIPALRAAIDLLRTLERRWRQGGRKRALLRYLCSVFDLYSTWKRAGLHHKAAQRIARLAGLHDRIGRHPVRAIIDATSKADRRSKSRWAQALRYASRKRDKWSSLTACLSANGGIAGCASKWADQQAWKRTPKGFVRVGGEDRFPKIPLFVEVELVDKYGNIDWDGTSLARI